jgi:cytochrome P450
MPLPLATRADTLAFLADVVGPVIAKGPIVRRPRMVGLAGKLDLDRRGITRMQRLSERYGRGPLMMRHPDRPTALILSSDHVTRVLDETPEPFATASSEKVAALAHFEPAGVLISRGPERAERRRYNEAVLESERAMHRLANRFVEVVDQEIEPLLRSLDGRPLEWKAFALAFRRIVRRVVLGDKARNDRELTDQLDRLRRSANWGWFGLGRRGLRARFLQRLAGHVARAEPGSLAAVMAATPARAMTAPVRQVPQWLFALDAVGLSVFRALALVVTHREVGERARAEVAAARGTCASPLPYLRAVLLESVRLWPTTPLVLRETTADTPWDGGMMPAGSRVVIFAPFFHRDGRHLPFADRLTPELWTRETRARDWPLIPFSRGSGECPGRQVALLLGSTLLAELLRRSMPALVSPPPLDPARPLPAGLDPFPLRFRLPGSEVTTT